MTTILTGDCIESMRGLADGSVNCCVTSPPYFGLRDYGVDGQIGLEETPDAYVAKMTSVFREVKRVLRDDGTLWLNIGDSYAGYHGNKNAAYDAAPSNKGGYFENQRKTLVNHNGIKNKDLIGIPWMLAFALRADGWYLRQDIIWHKPNPMPESVRDRCTKAHEYLFLLSKAPTYYFDHAAMQEPAIYGPKGSEFHTGKTGEHQLGRASKKRGDFAGKTNDMPGREAFRAIRETRNRRDVWTVATQPYKGAHFATFPPKLIEPCILAGCPVGGTVLDPFGGSGTTGMVANQHGRNAILCELNPAYVELAKKRCGMNEPELAIA